MVPLKYKTCFRPHKLTDSKAMLRWYIEDPPPWVEDPPPWDPQEHDRRPSTRDAVHRRHFTLRIQISGRMRRIMHCEVPALSVGKLRAQRCGNSNRVWMPSQPTQTSRLRKNAQKKRSIQRNKTKRNRDKRVAGEVRQTKAGNRASRETREEWLASG